MISNLHTPESHDHTAQPPGSPPNNLSRRTTVTPDASLHLGASGGLTSPLFLPGWQMASHDDTRLRV